MAGDILQLGPIFPNAAQRDSIETEWFVRRLQRVDPLSKVLHQISCVLASRPREPKGSIFHYEHFRLWLGICRGLGCHPKS